MTEEDYQNLFFLLNISAETFNDWWDSADQDDRDYALTLLKTAEHEIIDIIQEKYGDLSAAKSVLKKIFK
jgi:hypothetical protein